MKTKKIWESTIFRNIFLVIMVGLATVSFAQGVRNAAIFSQDFQWDAAKAFFLKINPYTESLNPTGALDNDDLNPFYNYFLSIDAPQKMEANQFPSLLMLLFPFTLMGGNAARYVWLFANLLFSAGIIWMLKKTFLKDLPDYDFSILMLVMIAGTPYRNEIGVGQHTVFALFFFLLAVYLSEKKWGSIPAALSLAVSYFKYTLTVPMAFYFVYKKKWKELIISVSVHIVMTIFAAWWLSASVIDMIVLPLKVSSRLIAKGGLDFGALFNGSPVSYVFTVIIFVGLFIMALKLKEGLDGEFISILVLWGLIIAYHRTYDFFVIVIVAATLTALKSAAENAAEDDVNAVKNYHYAQAGFAAIIGLVFFVLRIFDEAVWIRIIAGIVYYTYTIFITVLLIKKMEIKHGRKSK